MTQTRVEFNQRFMDTAMLLPGVQKLQEEVAERSLGAARSNAPVNTGAYKNGLRIRKVRRRYRYAYLVEGTDPKTLLIESKTGNLARSLKSASRR